MHKITFEIDNTAYKLIIKLENFASIKIFNDKDKLYFWNSSNSSNS